MERMCAQTRPRFILSSERVLGNGVRNHVNHVKGKNPLYWRHRGGLNPQRSITQDSEPITLSTELFLPPLKYIISTSPPDCFKANRMIVDGNMAQNGRGWEHLTEWQWMGTSLTSSPHTQPLWKRKDQALPTLRTFSTSHTYRLWSLYTQATCWIHTQNL